MLDENQKILVIARAIEAAFTSSEWTEIGYLTGTNDYIDGHSRLLRSLHWGDSDYKGHVIDAVAVILRRDPANLHRLLDYPPLGTWLAENESGPYGQLIAEASGDNVPDVRPTASTAAGLQALADAQILLNERGPVSAVDRVHTGFQAFLEGACKRAGLNPGESAAAPRLLKELLAKHPRLQNLGARSEEIRRIIRTSVSILDSLGTIRNNASLAHPNEDLLDRDEALLAINLARSLMRFLDSKLS